ncbi:carbon-nitrogen hydrolase family protein [Solirubrobacter sp. CPCC 204708]|uniref:Carbon-nitrogen hydrolase family protein n=1 Tax=Solirubrobacter deserti TaxID=2282478 RepID=A0ABT4RQA8_9ACTN|nr:carbon-nitrogen hydrolase family protein [Solirubrobacter deserti]MBE2319936.1 carbon-nitrogen hydrolase family protein [Solirubrobacter deserti]MDA0140470.1 carbon-nitrogen hydrolase family protein [Solirubrobacter deserti]
MRVAAVEAEAVPGEVERNLETAAELIARARADLVVFPEAFVTGYDDAVFGGALPSSDLAWIGPVQDAVDAHGSVVVLNTPLDRGTLSSVVLAPQAEPWLAYDKQHIYAAERTHFTAGERGTSFTLGDFEFALSVCYDANFPEHAAAAAADGAHVYLASGAYFPGGAHRRDLHYGARALDNGMYVVFAGLLGAPHAFIGGSAVFDPLGTKIASAQDGLAIAELHLQAVIAARETQRMWTDRRATLGDRRRHALG